MLAQTEQKNPLLGDFAAALKAGPGREWLRGVEPHEGPQESFLEADADIVIYGGQAGGGKTFALLVEPMRHVHNPRFGAVIFRRELTRITNEGGMWDEAMDLYPQRGAKPRQSPRMECRWPSGAKVQFAHLEHEDTKLAWSGAQIALLEFDQLEEFTEGQFWYLLGRNRTASGVRPYVRATANPVPPEDPVGGWLAKLIQWWWDTETGYPILERSGVVRWFVRVNEEVRWARSREEAVGIALAADVPREEAEVMPKSLTFIPASVDDNPSLGAEYRGNLLALPLVERERLARGNWKIRPKAGLVYNRAWFEIVDARPAQRVSVRAWDKAGSKGKGDHSSGLRLDYSPATKLFYVSDLVREQWSYGEREDAIKQTAELDGEETETWLEQEPGSGGKESAERSILNLAGHTVHVEPARGSKLARAGPAAAQAEAHNIKVVRAPWNEGFLQRLHNFTGADGGKDDDADALSLALRKLALKVSAPPPRVDRAAPQPGKPTLDERIKARTERRMARVKERRRA
jgi:predicted phage terminase large subunit-like protein